MNAIVVAICLVGGSSSSQCDALLARLSQTSASDPSALLSLGADCDSQGCAQLAKVVYEKVLKLAEDAVPDTDRCDAAFRLARIEIGRKQHERAFALLREVRSRCPGHEEARALLQSAESAQTREQVSNVAKGDESLAKEDFRRALGYYEKAFDLTPEGPTTAAYAPRSVVLSKLAQCRDRLDQIQYEKEFLPKTRSVKPCPICSGGKKKGFIDCPNCGGDGKITVRRPVRVGARIQMVTVEVPCDPCNGYGYIGCKCGALGYVSEEITPKEKEALWEVVAKVAHPKLFGLPLAEALKGVERTLLGVKEGASLNFLRAMEPDYSLSKNLKAAIGSVPPDDASVAKAEREWQGAAKDQRAKVSFLINYACEFADFVQHFDLLRGSKSPVAATYRNAEAWEGSVMTPELLSAFPDETKTSWVAVEGTISSFRVAAGEHKGYVEIEGEAPHTVEFFAWLPSAKPHLERLADVAWSRSVKDLDQSYPFDLWDRLAASPRDHRILLVGRFLRDRFGYPRNWFEVWDFRIGLGRHQERMLRALAKTLDISFSGLELRQVSEIFRVWFDLEIGFEGVDPTTRVSAEAMDCPKGLLVDAIARQALGADWYYQDGRAVLCGRGRNPIPGDMKAVVDSLGNRPPSSEATRVSASAGASREPDPAGGLSSVPSDPAGLRLAMIEAIRQMEYARADLCLEALLGHVDETRQRDAIARLRSKLKVFWELTRRTPVSRLAEAAELTDLLYKKRESDEFVQQTVILTTGKDAGGKEAWTVQEAYGASFRIDPEDVQKMPTISAAEWRKRREAELRLKESECESTPAESRVPKLFLLSLFAKTNKFHERGTDYLNRAIEAPGFDAFLGQFFPHRADELAALWREATGRKPELVPEPTEVAVAVPEGSGASAGAPAEPTGGGAEPAAEPVQPLPEGLSDGELLVHARRYAQEGSACARKVLEGDSAKDWRRKAIESFEQAEAAANRLLDRRPDDPTGNRLKRDIATMLATLKKDMGFFDS